MPDFISGIFQNVVANLIVLLVGGALAWIAVQRSRWRVVLLPIRLVKNQVSNIFTNRTEYISNRSLTVEQFICSASRSFEYIGLYFSVATDQSRIDDSIRTLIKKGCQVRLVLLDDGCTPETFAFLEQALALAPDSLRQRVAHAREHFVALRESLAPAQRSQMELRLHRLPLLASAFRIDEGEDRAALLVDIKWFGMGREKSFGVEFEGVKRDRSLFETVSTSFGKIADQATQI